MKKSNLEGKFEKKNIRNVKLAYVNTQKAYDQLIKEIAQELLRYDISASEAFYLKDAKQLEKKLSKLIAVVNTKSEQILKEAMVKNWELANQKNDILASQHLKNVHLTEEVRKDYFQVNANAMNSFINRSVDGMNLSKRVWQNGKAVMDQLNTYLGHGIAVGKPARAIANDVRDLVKEPKKLFLKNGVVLKPGTGVYKSAYANALRLAATETNMAYRMSEVTRRAQLPFITGIEVKLSGSHPRPDICDQMTGKYPPDFVFLGWHPRCFCYTLSIMLPPEEFVRQLENDSLSTIKKINTIPNQASKYVNLMRSKYERSGSTPYFLKDNVKYFNPGK